MVAEELSSSKYNHHKYFQRTLMLPEDSICFHTWFKCGRNNCVIVACFLKATLLHIFIFVWRNYISTSLFYFMILSATVKPLYFMMLKIWQSCMILGFEDAIEIFFVATGTLHSLITVLIIIYWLFLTTQTWFCW